VNISFSNADAIQDANVYLWEIIFPYYQGEHYSVIWMKSNK